MKWLPVRPCGGAGFVVLAVAAGIAAGCEGRTGESRPGPAAVAPAPAGDGAFAVLGAETGLAFVHDTGDGRLDNVIEAVGSGGAILDFDGDGRMDVYFVNMAWREGVSRGPRPERRAGNRLFRNLGGLRFEDVTERSGTGGGGFGVAAVAADCDGDGRTDLYVVQAGPNLLYRNLGGGRFEDVTARAGVGDGRNGSGAVFFDADGDGWLDLYVANYLAYDPNYVLHFAPDGFPGPLSYEPEADVLYRNRGDGTFEDVSATSGIAALAGRGMGVTAFDADEDGDTDLFVANDASPNFLLINDGRGRFRDVALESGVAYGTQGEATAAMAGILGDFDGDGRADLLVTDAAYGSLLRGLGGGRFEDVVFTSGAAAPVAQSPSWGAAWLDLENDGDRDLFIVSGDLHHPVGRADVLLENLGEGRFRDAAAKGGPWFGRSHNGRACLAADFDDDGDVDVLVTHLGEPAVLLRNETNSGNAWLTVALRGAAPNTDAAGAVVTVVAGGRSQRSWCGAASTYLGAGDPRLHFGLGAATTVERVEVRWASGVILELRDVTPGRTLVIREGAIR